MRRGHVLHPWGPEALTTRPLHPCRQQGSGAQSHALAPRHAVEPSGRCWAACPHLGLLGCHVGDGTKAQVARETCDRLRDLQSPGRGSLRIIKNFKTTMAER